MCGIIGYKGGKKSSAILLEGIKNLEYRGYDSVGIAIIYDGKIELKKDVGRVDEVNKKLNFLELNGFIGIGHTRWSTHGKPSKENAHPHISNDYSIAVVHNGIIENYNELRKELENEGFKFKSETDTEVIPLLIEKYNKKNDFEKAVIKALRRLEGSFAVIIINKDIDKLIAARRFSPLMLGVGKDEFFIASDSTAFIKHTNDIVFMEDDEMVIIDDGFKIVNITDNKIIDKKIEHNRINYYSAEKGNYRHFMLKEIHEQPRVVENTINYFIKNNSLLHNYKNFNRILIVACGTSYYAGLIGKFLIESIVRIPVEVDYSSEFRYKDPIINNTDLVIAISQSGETADTIAAAKEAKNKKAKLIAICNVFGSSLTRMADTTLYTQAGTEIGVASTKAFTSQLAVLYLFSLHLAKINKLMNEKEINKKIKLMKKLPLQMKKILSNNKIKEISEKNFLSNNSVFLGRGVNYPVALEGALKLKEISYIHAEGSPAAELKHGHIALIEKDMPVVVIAVKDKTYYKIKSNIEEIKSRGGKIISIVNEEDEEIENISDEVIEVPETDLLLYPFLTVIPMQLIAYYTGLCRNCDIDKPRNLAKSVTVE